MQNSHQKPQCQINLQFRTDPNNYFELFSKSSAETNSFYLNKSDQT